MHLENPHLEKQTAAAPFKGIKNSRCIFHARPDFLFSPNCFDFVFFRLSRCGPRFARDAAANKLLLSATQNDTKTKFVASR